MEVNQDKNYVLLIVKESGVRCYCTINEWNRFSEKTRNEVIVVNTVDSEREVKWHCKPFEEYAFDKEQYYNGYIISEDCILCDSINN